MMLFIFEIMVVRELTTGAFCQHSRAGEACANDSVDCVQILQKEAQFEKMDYTIMLDWFPWITDLVMRTRTFPKVLDLLLLTPS